MYSYIYKIPINQHWYCSRVFICPSLNPRLTKFAFNESQKFRTREYGQLHRIARRPIILLCLLQSQKAWEVSASYEHTRCVQTPGLGEINTVMRAAMHKGVKVRLLPDHQICVPLQTEHFWKQNQVTRYRR